jgi:hypothetical protein
VGDQDSDRGRRLAALIAGLAALAATLILGLIALLGFFDGVESPCGFDELNECDPSTSTRIEAIVSVPIAIVAVGAMLAVAGHYLAGAFGFLAPTWDRVRRFARASALACVAWVAWFLVYPEEPAKPEPLIAPEASCAGAMPAPEPGAVLLNRVVLVGYGTPERALGQELPSAPQGTGRFAKNGIQVLASGPVTLEVPPSAPDVTIDWGSTVSNPSKGVTLDPYGGGPCGEYRWVVYPGGFHYERPHCLPLRLEVDGSEMIVPVGLGKDCVGVRTS